METATKEQEHLLNVTYTVLSHVLNYKQEFWPDILHAYSCINAVRHSLGHSPCPHTSTHRIWALRPCSPSLQYNGLYPCNSCNYMDCYSFIDPGGMEG